MDNNVVDIEYAANVTVKLTNTVVTWVDNRIAVMSESMRLIRFFLIRTEITVSTSTVVPSP